jgi:hypothetical protein
MMISFREALNNPTFPFCQTGRYNYTDFNNRYQGIFDEPSPDFVTNPELLASRTTLCLTSMCQQRAALPLLILYFVAVCGYNRISKLEVFYGYGGQGTGGRS